MKKCIILILYLLFSFSKNSLEDCQAVNALTCEKVGVDYEIPEEYDIYGFQTPPRNDALGNYKSTYQDMRYLVGWAELSYNAAKTRCTIKFNTRVNPDLGVQDEDYIIYYTFGNFEEQESNEITLNSKDDSYPNGLSVSCRIVNMKTGNEAVSLQLQDIYLIWDNIEVNTPEEYKDGQRGSIVELFGWSFEDVAEECEFLGIAGYLGVKIFSPTESLLSEDLTEGHTLNPWWYGTQVASYKYNSRSGNQKQLKKMINRCRASNVRVYAEIVINHTTGDGNDVNPLHYSGTSAPCITWGPKPGSGGSPFFTASYQVQNNYYTNKPPCNEFPAIPYFPSDFHCGLTIENWDDPNQLCYGNLAGLQDINTEKVYTQKRIATLIVDLLSIGISGVSIANGRHLPNFSWAKIFRQVKEYLGGKLPPDFMAIINIENAKIMTILCSESGILDFGTVFTQKLKEEGFKDSEILQIKLWFKGILTENEMKYLQDYDPSCGAENEDELLFDVQRWTVSLEYSDDINMGDTGYNIYIKDKDVEHHKNVLINNLFLHPRYNYAIRFVFSSFSIKDINGIPDGKSEKSFCATTACLQNTVDLPFKRAFNPHSRGYDCGNGEGNWTYGEYSRVHRDADVINAMREWMFSTPDKHLTNEELYTHDELKAICDEKCLICNEESKRNNKCIFCDSNNNYYPVMETGGSEEYYECHKKDARVERFYYSNRDKAFLPCYETCRYCNELGDINDHKCTACDYNLVKKPGTKETAITFNCVTSCTYSYYYTESGQYKCTNTPICPPDRNIYIEEKQKCVSSCKEESPFIYLYNGNCIEQCPPGYTPDEINNICKIIRTDVCSFISKIETSFILFSSNTIDSFARSYRDEYSYTNKHITKISNDIYSIIIFKEFDCLEQVNINLPDIRYTTNNNRILEENNDSDELKEESCYIKVQKALNINEDLIVVYLEDKSDIVIEKGYLLYNPLTGTKTDFEKICGEDILTQKEDITVDEDSDEKYFNFIYLKSSNQNNNDHSQTSCKEGYVPVYINQMVDYTKCFNKLEKYEGIYYNNIFDMFIPCFENCKYCNKGGTSNENNCLECASGYAKHPLDGRLENFNCVAKCYYSYYFSFTGVYTCTTGPTCPLEYRYYINERKQCIDACKNDALFKYTYNGNCLKECPSGFISDENGICIQEDVNADKCTLSKKEAKLNNDSDTEGLNILVRNYYEEFYYTDKHVSEFNSSGNYNITIYIEKNCLTELNLNFPVIDFGSCYNKVQKESGLNQSLIVVLMKKYNKTLERSSSSYSLYNPLDGTKLDAANICKDEKIIVENSVLDILQESGIDFNFIKYLTDQNINIFDSEGAFYTDICYEFNSPVNRDITLEDRLKEFYPNISLCDEGCQSKGVNLTNMKAICSCTFTDITGGGSGIGIFKEYLEIISSSNIQVLKCMKYMFKKFDSSVGGFLMIFCIIIIIFMALIFYNKDIDIIKIYIIGKTTLYIRNINESLEEEDKKSNMSNESDDNKISNSKIKSNNKSKNGSGSISSSTNRQRSKKSNLDQSEESSDRKSNNILVVNKINGSKEMFSLNNKSNFLKNKNNNKSSKYIDMKNNKYLDINNKKLDEDFNKYLSPNVDDQEFEDIIIQDKRTFKEYFWDSLNEKQLFVNTFNYKDNFRPTSIKMVLFILTLVLYITINGLFYGEDEISEIYHIKGNDPFFGFFKRSITRYIYSAVVGVIIGVIIDLFFVQEKKLKSIFRREKRNVVNLKIQITILTKEIIIRYIMFLIFVLVLFIFIMFYLLCFNYVYPHTQGDWIKSSIFLIIIMQILSVLIALIQTCLRFFSFIFKNEKIFRLSKLLD